MTDTSPARPHQLRVACAYLGSTFAIQLVTVMFLVSDLGSSEGAKRVDRQIGWFERGGTSFGEAQTIFQLVATAVAVLAGMGIVFAVYASRGHHVSRVALTVLAGAFLLIGLGGVLGDDLFALILGFVGVFFSAQLWTTASRNYYRAVDGKPPLPTATRAAPVQHPVSATTYAPSVDGQVAPPPPPYAGQWAQATTSQPHVARPGREPLPKPVSIATWTTLIGSVVVGAVSLMLGAALLLIGSDDYEQMIRDDSLTRRMLDGSNVDFDSFYRLALIMSSIGLVLSLGGAVSALLVFARKRVGGLALTVMAGVTVIVSILSFPVGLPWTAAAIVVLVQLRRPEARTWFVRT